MSTRSIKDTSSMSLLYQNYLCTIECPIYPEGDLSMASAPSWRQWNSKAWVSQPAEQRENKLLPTYWHCHHEDITVRYCLLNVFANIWTTFGAVASPRVRGRGVWDILPLRSPDLIFPTSKTPHCVARM